MALQYLLCEVRKLNPRIDEHEEDSNSESLSQTSQTPETKCDTNAYRKPFIPDYQTINTHAMHAGAV